MFKNSGSGLLQNIVPPGPSKPSQLRKARFTSPLSHQGYKFLTTVRVGSRIIEISLEKKCFFVKLIYPATYVAERFSFFE
jgi:hypothetical protein